MEHSDSKYFQHSEIFIQTNDHFALIWQYEIQNWQKYSLKATFFPSPSPFPASPLILLPILQD